MAFRKSLAIAMIGSGLLCSVGGCGSKESGDDAEDSADQAGAPAPAQVAMDNANGANTAAAGMTGMQNSNPATGGMSGHAGSGGTTSGSGGHAAMASGGSAAPAGTGGAKAMDMDAAVAEEEDDLLGLLGVPAPDAVSCEGLLCVETADCASLYPDEAATCKFTSCVDFTCQ
jgi:hypothetical protein